MSYTITCRFYQCNTDAWFEMIEKTVWNYANGGSWTEVNDKQVLTMGGSGTSGLLRFKCGDEYFIVALGVHNYKRWCDVSTGLPSSDTACYIHPNYYNGGAGAGVREKQLSNFEATSPQGWKIKVDFNVSEGSNLECSICVSK